MNVISKTFNRTVRVCKEPVPVEKEKVEIEVPRAVAVEDPRTIPPKARWLEVGVEFTSAKGDVYRVGCVAFNPKSQKWFGILKRVSRIGGKSVPCAKEMYLVNEEDFEKYFGNDVQMRAV